MFSEFLSEIDAEFRQDEERQSVFQALIDDIHNLGSTVVGDFEREEYITIESTVFDNNGESVMYANNGIDEETMWAYQQNRADAYAYAAASQQEQRGVPPRVNWKKEGF